MLSFWRMSISWSPWFSANISYLVGLTFSATFFHQLSFTNWSQRTSNCCAYGIASCHVELPNLPHIISIWIRSVLENQKSDTLESHNRSRGGGGHTAPALWFEISLQTSVNWWGSNGPDMSKRLSLVPNMRGKWTPKIIDAGDTSMTAGDSW